MKKALSLVMVICLVFSISIVAFAEGGSDAVTSASTNYTAPAAGAAKVTPIVVPAGGVAYTVKSGDVMWKIAKDHGLTLDQLLKLNPWVKNANTIKVGQMLLVKAGTAAAAPALAASNELYLGQGMTTNFRVRGGTNFYFIITTASVLFDSSGKIVNSYFDVYEIGQSALTWPTADATITAEATTAQIAGWMSKREKGDTYGMAKAATSKNEWYVQMDNYQKFFEGKTVAELRTWFSKNTGATGKPINPATATDAAELAKVAALTEAEKATLVDVVSGATMSLSDSHSLIMEALEEAYKNKVLVK